jgi:hypothetical protein
MKQILILKCELKSRVRATSCKEEQESHNKPYTLPVCVKGEAEITLLK